MSLIIKAPLVPKVWYKVKDFVVRIFNKLKTFYKTIRKGD